MKRRELTWGLLAGLAGCGGGGGASGAVAAPVPAPATPPPPAPGGAMRDLTSLQLSRLLGAGWNLGNAMEAIGGETAWGNPAATLALMHGVRAAGFGFVRIPVAWTQYADAAGTISATWMARVAEVVGFARQAGLSVMINVHWDGGWLQPTYAARDVAQARLVRYWTQIATHFRDYDDGLLFAGTNEVMVTGQYGTPSAENVAVQNGFNQAFVSAVRATGGNNARRHLVVQGYNTDINHTLDFFVMPTDTIAQRLSVEVHYYDPYNFTLNGDSAIWQWGATATDPAAVEAWGNEAHADTQFARMKARFTDQGVAVVLGEYAAMRRTEHPVAEAFRLAWDVYIARAAASRGVVPVYWDAGAADANHSTGLLDRGTGQVVYPEIVRGLVQAGR